MVATARLPGIQFEVVAPPTSPALVRMDIAAFVGFAASGPINQPVAVESIVDFEEIFGSDLVVAADAGGPNHPVYAYLPSAVRAFFRNGGLRCWVVRVAGDGAAANLFPVAGLYALQSGSPTPTVARARSEGSWSDGLTVGIALRSHAVVATSFAENPYSVGLALQAPNEVSAGDLLRLTFPGTGDVLWLFVDAVAPDAGSSPPIFTQPGRLATASGATSFWEQLLSPPAGSQTPNWRALSSPPPVMGLPVCELITMDLFVQSGADDIWSLTQLGFAPAHPRYWRSLPDDETLYAMDTPSGLAQDAAHPRFPLGFTLADQTAGTYFLPLCAGPLPTFKPMPLPSADAIVRNGVSAFGSNLFLDPALTDTDTLDLMQVADYIRYQSPAPRTLRGIHAALAVDEATLIAAPDAVHRGWFQVADQGLASPPQSSPLQHPEWWHFLDCAKQQEIPRTSGPPAGEFQPVDLPIIPAPALALIPPEGGRYSLVWTPMAGAVDYLEQATDPEFFSARVIRQGASGNVTIYGRPPGDYYYRVRRQVGAFSSDYSNGVAVRIEAAAGWEVNPVAAYQNQPLLDVHSALLRMCAARGDMFAVLALPMHYRERDTMAHAAQLTAELGQSEQAAFSFGGLYHPWLTGHEENDTTNLRSNPPDGATCGIMAFRSSQRGPWISPANEPLHGVVALTPAMSRAYWQALQDAQINLLRQEPRGFLCLNASTLSSDPDVQPINVRRLMSFLRKTVLRAGVDYVFEPNSNEFRRGVQRGFEKVLDLLFLRGAFAGRTASDAFQVATDSRVNTPTTMALGQFFVEIRVAPSVPMRFLTVRLVQTADRTFVTEGP
jgi:hypothetical protein